MRLFLALSLSLMLASGVTQAADRPIVIAHRGASGLLPEHTIAAYTRAIDDGADFIEPDLVPTRDGTLVARHENEISGTTDVAARAEFADRKVTKTIDGVSVTGWFTEDFTLAELKTLRARERLPELRGTANDGRFEIPTLGEIIALAKARGVGIYPETKHPPYFIQSFEVNNLKRLDAMTGVRLIQLVAAEGGPADGAHETYAEMLTPEGLKAVAAYADGIGPEKTLVIPRGPDMRLAAPTRLVADAHAAGLKVHPWTFRAENYFLPADHRQGEDPRAHGDLGAEIRTYLAAGVDGVFSDFTAEAVAAR